MNKGTCGLTQMWYGSGFGSKFKWWEDEWIDNIKLKEKYPRIFNNSLIKDKTIENFGRWSSKGWEWVFSWRRV